MFFVIWCDFTDFGDRGSDLNDFRGFEWFFRDVAGVDDVGWDFYDFADAGSLLVLFMLGSNLGIVCSLVCELVRIVCWWLWVWFLRF